MWGALDNRYALRNSTPLFHIKSRRTQLWPFPNVLRPLALTHLVWESHFLPCHPAVMLTFSVIYTSFVPPGTLHPTLVRAFSLANLIRTLSFIGMNINLTIYYQWHQTRFYARRHDMVTANLRDCGFSSRALWHAAQLKERICFPVSGIIFGAVAM